VKRRSGDSLKTTAPVDLVDQYGDRPQLLPDLVEPPDEALLDQLPSAHEMRELRRKRRGG
jgi:hypothetical protein